MVFTFYDLIFILCLIYKYTFLTNLSSLLRKAIHSRLGELGKKTEPSNAVTLNILYSTILTKSLSSPLCDHSFHGQMFSICLPV